MYNKLFNQLFKKEKILEEEANFNYEENIYYFSQSFNIYSRKNFSY